MTDIERLSRATEAVDALLPAADKDRLVLIAKLLAVQVASYRRAYGVLAVAEVLPLLADAVSEPDAGILADGMEYLERVLTTAR